MRDACRGRMDICFKTVLLLVVFNKVHLYRQLMNTTCLELARPSNKHLHMSCNDSSIYHCLLNGNRTNEFEICKMWSWIPEGNCAYLNEYGRNIDARLCSSSAELACPKTLYRSEETIKYAACYIKKNTNSKASPALVTSNNLTSNGDIEKSSTSKAWIFSLFTGIAVFLSIAAILFFRGYMDNPLCKIVNSDANDPADMNESDSSEHFEEAPFAPTTINQKNSEVSTDEHQKGDDGEFRTNEVESNTSKPAEVDISKDLKDGETTADKSDNEEGDTQEKTDVFNDTVESLQRIAHSTDEDSKELCTGLYNLLGKEGLKLIQEVMAATISRLTGKSVETLFNDLTDQEESKLKETEEFNCIFESKEERKKSVYVLYSLHKFFLDEELCPKTGWGNPVWGKTLVLEMTLKDYIGFKPFFGEYQILPKFQS